MSFLVKTDVDMYLFCCLDPREVAEAMVLRVNDPDFVEHIPLMVLRENLGTNLPVLKNFPRLRFSLLKRFFLRLAMTE